MITRLMGKASIALLSLLFSSQYILAQAPSTPTVNLIVQPVGTTMYDPLRDTFPPFLTDTAKIGLVLILQDTTNINSIQVTLGTTSGGSDLLSQSFSFDSTGSMGNGTSFYRHGYGAYLGLGKFIGFTQVYNSVVLVNGSGPSATVTSSFP